MSKEVCINTPEELMKVLKEGKTVYFSWLDDDGNKVGNESVIKLVDGIILHDLMNGDLRWNATLVFSDAREYYYFEEEKIKLKVGQYYKTECGRVAFCFSTAKGWYRYVVVGDDAPITVRHIEDVEGPLRIVKELED